MNQKIPFHELAKKISGTTSISEESAEVSIKNFFDLLGEVVVDGESVKIKGLGSFSVSSVNGERIVEFIPDKEISEVINAPFESFEPVVLNDGVTTDMLSDVGSELTQTMSDSVSSASPDSTVKSYPEAIEPVQIAHDETAPDNQNEQPIPSQELVHTQDDIIEECKSEVVEVTDEGIVVSESRLAGLDEGTLTTNTEPLSSEEKTDSQVQDNTTLIETGTADAKVATAPDVNTEGGEQKQLESKKQEVVVVPPVEIAATTTVKSPVLEEEPEEYVEHVSESESNNGGFGWGFLVGLIVGLALGACAVYLAIDYLFPHGRLSTDNDATESISDDIQEEAVLSIDSVAPPVAEDSVQTVQTENSGAEAGLAVASPVQPESEKSVSQAQVPAVRRDTVRRGYLIHDMSKKYYGAKDFWVYIYEENKSKIGNPNKMQPGEVLIIPAPEKYGIDASNPESLRRARNKAGEILSKYK